MHRNYGILYPGNQELSHLKCLIIDLDCVNLTDESKQKFKILLLMLSNILEPSISKDTITGLYVNKNNKNEVIYISEVIFCLNTIYQKKPI